MLSYNAVRYIRYAEAAIVAILLVFALWTYHELSVLRKAPVYLPNYEFEVTGPADAPVVQTRGTWVAGERVGEPLRTISIECRKATMRCVESSAGVVFVGDRGVLEVSPSDFEVDRWTDKEVVTKTLEGPCNTRTLTLDLAQKRATSRVSASSKGVRCVEAPERTLQLLAGYKARAD